MSASSIQYKTNAEDSNSLFIMAFVFPLLLAIWIFLKLKGGDMLKKSIKADLETPVNIIFQSHLPRGGLIIQVKIEDEMIYLVESNKSYFQINLPKKNMASELEVSNNDS